MAREILFKAKEKHDGDWIQGFLSMSEGEYVICGKDGVGLFIDESTICQYTGLTDKNGRKIFDGDILVLVEGSTHPIKVYWDGLGWKFLRNGKNIEDAFESNTIGHIRICEVVGNILDNPELLGGGER